MTLSTSFYFISLASSFSTYFIFEAFDVFLVGLLVSADELVTARSMETLKSKV